MNPLSGNVNHLYQQHLLNPPIVAQYYDLFQSNFQYGRKVMKIEAIGRSLVVSCISEIHFCTCFPIFIFIKNRI